MCYILDAEILIMNYFSVNSRKTVLSSNQLVVLKRKLEDSFDKTVFVDLSASAVRCITIRKRQYFELHSAEIKLVERRKFTIDFNSEVLECQYNWQIPSKIRLKLLTLLSDDGQQRKGL